MTQEDRFRHATLVLTELGKPSVFAGIAPDPIDLEVIPNFDGSADRIAVWLIYADRETAGAATAVASELTLGAGDVLAAAGFPAAGLESLGVFVTSMPDIEDGGGRFAFFRSPTRLTSDAGPSLPPAWNHRDPVTFSGHSNASASSTG